MIFDIFKKKKETDNSAIKNNSLDVNINPSNTLYDEVKWILNEYEKIGYDIKKIQPGLSKIKKESYTSYFDYADLLRNLYTQYGFGKTSSLQGIYSQKSINTLKILYTGFSRHYVLKNWNSDDIYRGNEIYDFYTSSISNFIMSLGNRKSDEFYQLLSDKEVIGLMTQYLSQYNFQDIYSILKESISRNDYEISDLIFENIYNTSTKNNLDYFNVMYEWLIDQINAVKFDETGRELLLKWAEKSSINERAKIVISGKKTRFKKAEKTNYNLEEINTLIDDVIKNKDRLYKCLFDINKNDSNLAVQIEKNIFESNYKSAFDSFDMAEALFRIISAHPLSEEVENIEQMFKIINSYKSSKIPQYRMNSAFSYYIRALYYDCLEKKKLLSLDVIEDGVYNLSSKVIKDNNTYNSEFGISISISSSYDDISLRTSVMSNILWQLSKYKEDAFIQDRVAKLVSKINSKEISELYNKVIEKDKIYNEEYNIAKLFVESVTDKKKLELISTAYRKMLKKLNDNNLDSSDLETIFSVVSNNFDLFKELPTGESMNLLTMFFDVMDATTNPEMIRIILSNKKINYNIEENVRTYNMYNQNDYGYYQGENEIWDTRFKKSILSFLLKCNCDDELLNKLKNLISLIEDAKTKNNIISIFDTYSGLEKLSNDKLEKVNDNLVEEILGYKVNNLYTEFILKISKDNYKFVSYLISKYTDRKIQNDSYDADSRINIGNTINQVVVANGVEYFNSMINFNEPLKKYYFEKCIDMYHIVGLRNKISVDNFIEMLNIIIPNVEDKNDFITKCLSSINYRKIITPYEIDYFENEIMKIPSNDKLMRKLELLKKKVSE